VPTTGGQWKKSPLAGRSGSQAARLKCRLRRQNHHSAASRHPAHGKRPPFQPVQLAVPGGGGEGRIHTQSGADWSDRFVGPIAGAAQPEVESALIDGEAVALSGGRTSFQALQAALKDNPAAIECFAFDLLESNGEDLAWLLQIKRNETDSCSAGLGCTSRS